MTATIEQENDKNINADEMTKAAILAAFPDAREIGKVEKGGPDDKFSKDYKLVHEGNGIFFEYGKMFRKEIEKVSTAAKNYIPKVFDAANSSLVEKWLNPRLFGKEENLEFDKGVSQVKETYRNVKEKNADLPISSGGKWATDYKFDHDEIIEAYNYYLSQITNESRKNVRGFSPYREGQKEAFSPTEEAFRLAMKYGLKKDDRATVIAENLKDALEAKKDKSEDRYIDHRDPAETPETIKDVEEPKPQEKAPETKIEAVPVDEPMPVEGPMQRLVRVVEDRTREGESINGFLERHQIEVKGDRQDFIKHFYETNVSRLGNYKSRLEAQDGIDADFKLPTGILLKCTKDIIYVFDKSDPVHNKRPYAIPAKPVTEALGLWKPPSYVIGNDKDNNRIMIGLYEASGNETIENIFMATSKTLLGWMKIRDSNIDMKGIRMFGKTDLDQWSKYRDVKMKDLPDIPGFSYDLWVKYRDFNGRGNLLDMSGLQWEDGQKLLPKGTLVPFGIAYL